MSLFEWFKEPENTFFAGHVAFVFILAAIAEMFASGLTTFLYPGLLVVSVASFLYNYPVKAIKSHGLFSEYLIELRVLWLVILGVFSEYFVYQVFERYAINIYLGIALLIGILLIFYCHSTLHRKITEARGFK